MFINTKTSVTAITTSTACLFVQFTSQVVEQLSLGTEKDFSDCSPAHRQPGWSFCVVLTQEPSSRRESLRWDSPAASSEGSFCSSRPEAPEQVVSVWTRWLWMLKHFAGNLTSGLSQYDTIQRKGLQKYRVLLRHSPLSGRWLEPPHHLPRPAKRRLWRAAGRATSGKNKSSDSQRDCTGISQRNDIYYQFKYIVKGITAASCVIIWKSTNILRQ